MSKSASALRSINPDGRHMWMHSIGSDSSAFSTKPIGPVQAVPALATQCSVIPSPERRTMAWPPVMMMNSLQG